MTTDTLPPAANADHLTMALRKAAVLGDGRVRDVAIRSSRDTIVSHIIRLDLSYDGPAHEAPPSVILKVAHSNYASALWNSGRQEVAFYTEIAPLMSAHLAPRCYEGSWNAETHAWHLLLEDLTDSHQIGTVWPLPPTFKQSKSIVRALAKAHAEWWDDPRLGHSIGAWLDKDALNRIMQQFAGHFGRFADQVGDRLPDERRDLYERLIDAAPELMKRYHSHRNVTITHGDAHVWNFLLPQDPARDDVRLFDFDQWGINVGSSDLAYMMAMHWYPDRRRLNERPLLDCYHDILLAHGVNGYDRRALDEDYRRPVLWHITKPLWQWAAGLPSVIWWNNLERIFLAVDDLGCRELLD
jgi:thiamine kinase-like enzyme